MNIIYLRCLIEFAFNSQCVIGATQILPITLWDLLFMRPKKQILPWDIIWNLKIIKEIDAIKKIRRFTTECIKCSRIADKYMNSILSSKTWCKCTNSWWWEDKKGSIYSAEEKRLYSLFSTLKQRCINKDNPDYITYGWKWIKCEWETFHDFFKDMWPTYQEGLSIDRIDWNWNYCKENCRWADKFTQNNNRSNNILVEWWLTLSQWCRTNGIHERYRIILSKYKKWYTLKNILIDIERIKSRKLLNKNVK